MNPYEKASYFTGSEVILCGLLGADVTGIDIKEERLNVAKKRIKYYENEMNTKINVKFSLENISNPLLDCCL